MRCSCQLCGTYMVQQERGLDCRCICPNCFNTCAACMGTSQQPLSKEDMTALLARRARLDAEREETGESAPPDPDGELRPW